MIMEIRPILSALMRSKVALILIGLQIALTLAIVCNALFIINQRFDTMGRPSGMNEADTFTIDSLGFGSRYNVQDAISEDLALLRGLPGVASVAPIISVPMSNSGWSEGASLTKEQKNSTTGTAIFFMDEHGLDTYGAKLIAGRDFKPEEISFHDPQKNYWPPSVIVTKELAQKMFPDVAAADVVGKQFYLDTEAPPNTIVGVIERLQAPWVHSKQAEYNTLIPQIIAFGNQSRYLVRAQSGRRDEVLKAAQTKLEGSRNDRIVREATTVERVRKDNYNEDRAMTIILGGVISALLIITALGLVGMASFWVTQRTKQIGTRRALGATRANIRNYFLTENFVITSIGLLLGAALAYGFNLWLMAHYSGTLLPWYYVPVGFLMLWLLGQVAVLGPATRASRVPPAVATRSV
jgi:putative ABC transport system permease protein